MARAACSTVQARAPSALCRSLLHDLIRYVISTALPGASLSGTSSWCRLLLAAAAAGRAGKRRRRRLLPLLGLLLPGRRAADEAPASCRAVAAGGRRCRARERRGWSLSGATPSCRRPATIWDADASRPNDRRVVRSAQGATDGRAAGSAAHAGVRASAGLPGIDWQLAHPQDRAGMAPSSPRPHT